VILHEIVFLLKFAHCFFDYPYGGKYLLEFQVIYIY